VHRPWRQADADLRSQDHIFDRKTIAFEPLEYQVIVVGANADSNTIVILARGADHGRSTDIDILDGVVNRCILARDGLLKRIEINDEQIDGLDAVLLHDSFVLATTSEQAAVDNRVQRLDASIHDLGETGFFGHLDDFKTSFAKLAAGATR
jgi:hypothetical protein